MAEKWIERLESNISCSLFLCYIYEEINGRHIVGGWKTKLETHHIEMWNSFPPPYMDQHKFSTVLVRWDYISIGHRFTILSNYLTVWLF